MGKILLLALAVWLLLTVLKSYRRNLDATPSSAKGDGAKSSNMVRCERCGIHVPMNESVLKDGKRYCCEAHSTPDQP